MIYLNLSKHLNILEYIQIYQKYDYIVRYKPKSFYSDIENNSKVLGCFLKLRYILHMLSIYLSIYLILFISIYLSIYLGGSVFVV